MNRIGLIVGVALIGSAAVAVWSTSRIGDGLQASAADEASSVSAPAGLAMHHLQSGTQIERLLVAPNHDHGFVFAP